MPPILRRGRQRLWQVARRVQRQRLERAGAGLAGHTAQRRAVAAAAQHARRAQEVGAPDGCAEVLLQRGEANGRFSQDLLPIERAMLPKSRYRKQPECCSKTAAEGHRDDVGWKLLRENCILLVGKLARWIDVQSFAGKKLEICGSYQLQDDRGRFGDAVQATHRICALIQRI